MFLNLILSPVFVYVNYVVACQADLSFFLSLFSIDCSSLAPILYVAQIIYILLDIYIMNISPIFQLTLLFTKAM